jgi:hypothetical protein
MDFVLCWKFWSLFTGNEENVCISSLKGTILTQAKLRLPQLHLQQQQQRPTMMMMMNTKNNFLIWTSAYKIVSWFILICTKQIILSAENHYLFKNVNITFVNNIT